VDVEPHDVVPPIASKSHAAGGLFFYKQGSRITDALRTMRALNRVSVFSVVFSAASDSDYSETGMTVRDFVRYDIAGFDMVAFVASTSSGWF